MSLESAAGVSAHERPDDTPENAALVQLLLDAATRRDLDDPVTIERVATAIKSIERLRVIALLAESAAAADSSSASQTRRTDLVRVLVDRVTRFLQGEGAEPLERPTFPTATQLSRLADGDQHIDAVGTVLTVMTSDRPGAFSRIAGVLALHDLDVFAAAAHSTDTGRALAEFHVDPVQTEATWDQVIADLALAFAGRLALNARLADRMRTGGQPMSPDAQAPTVVRFDDDASADATVIDVETSDGVGVLYRITVALAELDLDIRTAKIETRGDQVLDAFYVRDSAGAKIVDVAARGEVERAIRHSLHD